MSTPTHAGVGQQFHELYRRLSRHQANALLNDCIYELPAAWKFLTALQRDLPVLVILHGFSSMPLAFARHLCRVDIRGLNQTETVLFHELAKFKKISNYRICRDAHEIAGPYGLILWLPTRQAVAASHEDDWLLQVTAHLHQDGELWLAHCYKPDWRDPMNRLQRIMRRIKSREYETLPAQVRLLQLAEPIPHQSLLETLTVKLAAPANGHSPLRRMNHFGIVPHWSSPVQIAPMPSSPGSMIEKSQCLRMLEQKKLFETHHALAQFGQAPASSFLSRLLHELQERESGSSFQLNHYRVLAGGKVQIDARWKKPRGEQSVFIKLPLIPFAAARLRQQNTMLRYLYRNKALRQFDMTPFPFAQTAQRMFPQILAQGDFEGQPYFLEGRIKGAPLSRLNVSREIFRRVCDTLFAFWHGVQACCGAVADVNERKFDQIFRRPLQLLMQWAKTPPQYEAAWQRLEDFFAAQFVGQRLFFGLVHGDFSTKNILAHHQSFELSGVIDLDIAARESIPALDVLHFFVRQDPGSFREAPVRIAMRLIRAAPSAPHWLYLHQALDKFGYDRKLLPAVVAYYWVQRLQIYLDSPKYLDTAFMQRQIYEVLDFFNAAVLKK
jgi:hypothetical protein